MWLKTLINAHLFLSFEQNFFDKNSYNVVSDNQIEYIACPKDEWIRKFFSYSLRLITNSKYIYWTNDVKLPD